jgi:drug/metabolite transporter (DMT)-like permease
MTSTAAAAHATRLRQMGLLLAIGGAVAFSAKAIVAKLIYRYGVDAVTLIAWRMALALPFFVAMAWWGARGRAPIRRNQWPRVALLGFTGYYLASFLDFWGLEYISASLERLILYLSPTFVLLLGRVFLGKSIGLMQLGAMALSYAGIALVFGHEVRLEGRDTLIGGTMVLGSAISYATYLLLSGQLVREVGSMRLVGMASVFASVLCLLQFAALRPLASAVVAAPVVWWSLANALVCTALPMLMVMMAVERLGPGITSQAGMVGPMSTLLLAVWWLDEPFNGWILAGTALVLLGVFWVSRLKGT